VNLIFLYYIFIRSQIEKAGRLGSQEAGRPGGLEAEKLVSGRFWG
jgi:hypothetical protein